MKKIGIVMLLVLAVAITVTSAIPERPGACMAAAREDVLSCRAECANDFRNARFECRGVEPGCGRECLGRRESCIDTATQPLEECLGVCKTSLNADKSSCQESCGTDAVCLDSCIDLAQANAFTCRDNCREAFRAGGGVAVVEQCRVDFRTCVDLCPRAGR